MKDAEVAQPSALESSRIHLHQLLDELKNVRTEDELNKLSPQLRQAVKKYKELSNPFSSNPALANASYKVKDLLNALRHIQTENELRTIQPRLHAALNEFKILKAQSRQKP